MGIFNPTAGGAASLPYTHALYLVTDDGTNLTQTEVYNDTGLTFTFSWQAGDTDYQLDASGPIVAAKTPVLVGPLFQTGGAMPQLTKTPWGNPSANSCQFLLSDGAGSEVRSSVTSGLNQTAFEIRIYP